MRGFNPLSSFTKREILKDGIAITDIKVSIHSLHLRREKYSKSFFSQIPKEFQSTLFIYEERNASVELAPEI